MSTMTPEKSKVQPYKPSWIDGFNNWVANLPVRKWIFYVVFGIVLILIQIVFLWLDGGLQAEQLLPIIIFNALAIPFLLALIHLLDSQSVTAVNSMKPVLNTSGQEFERFEFSLSNMPFLAPLVSGFTMLILVIVMERLVTVPIRYAALEQLPSFTIVFQIIDKIPAFLVGVFIYHTIRQLLIVNSINSNHIRINLYNLGPSRAFSKLTASTAIAFLFFVYLFMFINPELLTDPVIVGSIVTFTILAGAVFVWPLYGVHRVMEAEKERALHEINIRFEGVFSVFNQRLDEDDYDAIQTLNGTISSLEIQHNKVMAIPTWPWRPESFRNVLTAIALPLVLMILRYLVEQALNL